MRRYLLLFVILVNLAGAQPKRLSEAFEQDRSRASVLVQEGKYKDAQKILAALLAKAPEDTGVMFQYGYALFLEAEVTTNIKAQNQLRKEARGCFLKAKEIGLKEPLLDQMLAAIREDGSKVRTAFSRNGEAESAMRQGEVAFSKRDFPAALQHYARALELEPQLYGAALFTGDIHFAQQQYAEAIKWFGKAVQINPNIETAHRYWGDALGRSGNFEAAGDKYLQAVIAEPGNGLPWRALDDWARRKGLQPRHPATKIPSAKITVKNGKVELGVDPNAGVVGMAYALARGAAAGKALEEHKAYRHSLEEEEKSLHVLLEISAAVLADPKPAGDQKISAAQLQQIEQLKKVTESGFLAPYIFFVRADAELAADYAAYREDHREMLYAYLRQVFLGLKPEK